MKTSPKQIAVIGLGKFGMNLAKKLSDNGAEVLAIDKDREKVDYAITYSGRSLQMNAADEASLPAIGVSSFDEICICVGSEESSAIITLLCKEMGARYIIAKANNERHAEMLKRIGADSVIIPEKHSGINLANRIVPTKAVDMIEVSADFGIAEIPVTRHWLGKTISDLRFRDQYGLCIVAIIRSDGENIINPLPSYTLHSRDTVVVLGAYDNINALSSGISAQGQ